MYSEITEKLNIPFIEGNLLDVGTGLGLLLKAIHQDKPQLRLYGLDISEPVINAARKNLKEIEDIVDLRVASIENTDYEDNFFNLVTCTASFSYWSNPVQCLDEIYRILKPEGIAILFEPVQDLDMDLVMEEIDAKLKDASRIRRFFARNLNKYGLKYGRRFGLTLYSLDEVREMADKSRFIEHSIERTSIMDMPIWMQITLIKQ